METLISAIKILYVVNWIMLLIIIVVDMATIIQDYGGPIILPIKKTLLTIILPFYYLWPSIARLVNGWIKKLK